MSATQQLQKITVNLQTDLVRDEILHGEEHWVAPLVMMVECVANGSQGSLFYPGEEIEKWSPSWNNKPIVAPDHPEDGSACTQEFLNNHQIGVVLDTKYDGKQRAMGWFNKKRTTLVSPKVANALKAKKTMELSTGLYVDNDAKAGVYEKTGDKYVGTATNYRPDHLAILPDKIGAFSIAKGAGLLALNEASFENITRQLESLLRDMHREEMKQYPNLYHPYVKAVYDTYCIYCFGGNDYRIDYTVSSDKVALKGDPVRVEMRVDYVTVENSQENDDMSKKELIDKIIKNTERTHMEESDRKYLEGLNEERLEKMAKAAEPPKKEDPKPAFSFNTQAELDAAVQKGLAECLQKDPAKLIKDATDALAKNAGGQNPPNPQQPNQGKPVTAQEWYAAMPPEMRVVHNNMAKAYNGEVQRLVEKITANKANKIKPDDLLKLDYDVLKNMADMCSPEMDPNQQLVMPMTYYGQSPVGNTDDTSEEGMGVPVYNDAKFGTPPGAKK